MAENTQNEKKITLDNINKLRGILGDDGLLGKLKSNALCLEKDVKGFKATLSDKIKVLAEERAKLEVEKTKEVVAEEKVEPKKVETPAKEKKPILVFKFVWAIMAPVDLSRQ